MVPIKIKEFAKKYVETNKDEKLDDVIKDWKNHLREKILVLNAAAVDQLQFGLLEAL